MNNASKMEAAAAAKKRQQQQKSSSSSSSTSSTSSSRRSTTTNIANLFATQTAREKVRAIAQAAPDASAAVTALSEHAVSLHVQLGETQRITKAKEDEESRTAKSMLKMRTKIAELTADPSQGTADDCILQLVGKGFGCPRTMRLHSAEWRNKIMAEYGTDVRKARQMVEHLASRFNIQMEGPLAPATRRCKCSTACASGSAPCASPTTAATPTPHAPPTNIHCVICINYM